MNNLTSVSQRFHALKLFVGFDGYNETCMPSTCVTYYLSIMLLTTVTNKSLCGGIMLQSTQKSIIVWSS